LTQIRFTCIDGRNGVALARNFSAFLERMNQAA